MYKPN